MSPRCAEKLARLQAIVAERAAWAGQLAQVKRMHGWVLEVEHLLDGSWAHAGEEVSNETVGSRLDGWREQMAEHLADGTLSELERECLTECLQVLTNEAFAPGEKNGYADNIDGLLKAFRVFVPGMRAFRAFHLALQQELPVVAKELGTVEETWRQIKNRSEQEREQYFAWRVEHLQGVYLQNQVELDAFWQRHPEIKSALEPG